jgi:hypothetical protein
VLRSSRVFTVIASAFALASVGMAAGMSPASAGFQGAPLSIVKTVSGTVPAGTTFTATIECDGPIIDDGESGADAALVQFDAAGQPIGLDSVEFINDGSCTVTEVNTGGAASTTYACEGTVPPLAESSNDFGTQQEAPPICPEAGPQAGPIDVNIVFSGQAATVTINNTFADPTPTPITPAPQIVAQPAFTG